MTRLKMIREVISDIKELNLKETEIDEIKNKLMKLISIQNKYLIEVVGANFPKMYRARHNKRRNKFINLNDLWYNDMNVNNYGRFNNIGESIFYCSPRWETCIYELKPNIGDIITILECEPIDREMPLKVANIFFSKNSLYNGIEMNIKPIIENPKAVRLLESNENIEMQKLIIDFFEGESLRHVNVGEEYNYKISVAIKDILFTILDVDAISYPSLSNDGSICFAVRPNVTDQYYKPMEVTIVRLESQEGLDYNCKCLSKSQSIDIKERIINYSLESLI